MGGPEDPDTAHPHSPTMKNLKHQARNLKPSPSGRRGRERRPSGSPHFRPSTLRVLKAVRAHPEGISVPELVEIVQVSRVTLYRALNFLERRGLVRLKRGGGRGIRTYVFPATQNAASEAEKKPLTQNPPSPPPPPPREDIPQENPSSAEERGEVKNPAKEARKSLEKVESLIRAMRERTVKEEEIQHALRHFARAVRLAAWQAGADFRTSQRLAAGSYRFAQRLVATTIRAGARDPTRRLRDFLAKFLRDLWNLLRAREFEKAIAYAFKAAQRLASWIRERLARVAAELEDLARALDVGDIFRRVQEAPAFHRAPMLIRAAWSAGLDGPEFRKTAALYLRVWHALHGKTSSEEKSKPHGGGKG